MQKRVLFISAALIVAVALFLVVTTQVEQGWQETFETNANGTAGDVDIYTAGDDDIYLEEEQYTQRIYEAMLDAPHPFAIALKEYMANYDGVVRAYLVTLYIFAFQYLATVG